MVKRQNPAVEYIFTATPSTPSLAEEAVARGGHMLRLQCSAGIIPPLALGGIVRPFQVNGAILKAPHNRTQCIQLRCTSIGIKGLTQAGGDTMPNAL